MLVKPGFLHCADIAFHPFAVGQRCFHALNTSYAGVAVGNQMPHCCHSALIIVGSHIGEPGVLKIAVHEHYGEMHFIHHFQLRRVIPARGYDQSVHLPRRKGPDALLLKTFVLGHVHNYRRIALLATFRNHNCRNVSKILIGNRRKNQPYHIRALGTQTAGHGTRCVVAALGFIHNHIPGLVADAVFFRIAAEDSRNRSHRNSEPVGYGEQGLSHYISFSI